MLQMRLEGDPAEARALYELLRAAGAQVQAGTVKARAEGFSHCYAVVALPDSDPGPAGPVRVTVVQGRALPAGDRRPERRR
jgi:hypothetical protein